MSCEDKKYKLLVTKEMTTSYNKHWQKQAGICLSFVNPVSVTGRPVAADIAEVSLYKRYQ